MREATGILAFGFDMMSARCVARCDSMDVDLSKADAFGGRFRVLNEATAWAISDLLEKMSGRGRAVVVLNDGDDAFSGLASTGAENSSDSKACKTSLSGPDVMPQHSIILSSSSNSPSPR